MKYEPAKIEKKWQKEWEESGIYVAKDSGKNPAKGQSPRGARKWYSLFEFPYPSGDGLHVGHLRPYIGMDVISRKRRMEGYNVLFPIGWDAFGLPTENYALKTGISPQEATKKNTDNFRRQIKSVGPSLDWSREINTTDPEYYKWTQWMFLKFFEKGLAYKAKTFINWCPKDKIGLANEEVVGGACERCGTPVEKREKEQWMIKITAYAEELLKGLKDLDFLPEIKRSQENWIGKSEGAEIDFELSGTDFTGQDFLILHAHKSSSASDFYPWLKKELEGHGGKVAALNLPGGTKPNVEKQIEFVLKNFRFSNKTTIITHSLGAPLALKLIPRLKTHIKRLVMVAPPINSTEFVDGKKRPELVRFCDWKFDFKTVKAHVAEIVVLRDLKDCVVPQSHPQEIARKLGARLIDVTAALPHFEGATEPAIWSVFGNYIKVFTTRPDTIFGATYMVLAPEHQLVQGLKEKIKNWNEVEAYIVGARERTDMERTAEGKEKSGVELKGVTAINPATKKEIPVWIADYVLPHYGTGAIMAVPAHDERDFAFATKFRLPITQVIAPIIELTGLSASQSGKKLVKRNVVSAIIRNPKNDTYLLFRWPNGEYGLCGGGIEEGESPEETVKREVVEETGYTDFVVREKVFPAFFGSGYKARKDINCFDFENHYFIELNSEQQTALHKDDIGKHEHLWVEKQKVLSLLTLDQHRYLWNSHLNKTGCYTGEGLLMNSDKFDGVPSREAMKKITESVGGKMTVQYKLRDWVFSRQRYWGEPIPLVHCKEHGWVAVPEKELPVELPKVVRYQPTDTGESPLSAIKEWVNIKCSVCKGPAKRETDTMPNWAGSSWYFLRYTDPHNAKQFALSAKLKHWMPVDWYNGGMEHTTLHLLYSRFWNRFLYDLKLVPTAEPYKKRTAHGLVLAEGGVKMSKSKGNVINPDDLVKEFGADSLRLYEMFMGPFEQAIAWDKRGILGTERFLKRVWEIGQQIANGKAQSASNEAVKRLVHKALKKVSEDIESMAFNTAVSTMMTLANELINEKEIGKAEWEIFLKMLAPFAPHITEELWQQLTANSSKLKAAVSIHLQPWPKFDPKLIKEDTFELVIQINSRVRDRVSVPMGITQADAEKLVLARDEVKKWVTAAPKKVIFVKDRLINFII